MSTATTLRPCIESASLPSCGGKRSGHHARPLEHFLLEPLGGRQVESSAPAPRTSPGRRRRPAAPTTAATARTPSRTRSRDPRTPTRSLAHCRNSSASSHAPSPASRPRLSAAVERGVELRRAQQLQPEPRAARLRQRIGEQARAGIVEIDHRHEIEPRAVHLARDGAPQAFDLRCGRRGDLAGDGDGAADDAGRGRWAYRLLPTPAPSARTA